MSLVKTVLHAGAFPASFNHFINNDFGYFGFEPTTDEFEVNDDVITQGALDGRATAYQGAQATADAQYQAFLDDEKITGQQQRYAKDEVSQAVAEVMRGYLNELRALHSLADITEAEMDTAINDEIANP
jgi:hypothetical protein